MVYVGHEELGSMEAASPENNRISMDFLCSFIFRKALMEIKL